MTPLILAVWLIQTVPPNSQAVSPAPSAATSTTAPVASAAQIPNASATSGAAPTEPAPNPEDTYQGLQQVYSTTCGQTGILYHAYDEICESLRKQIKSYRDKIDREQSQAARNPPKP